MIDSSLPLIDVYVINATPVAKIKIKIPIQKYHSPNVNSDIFPPTYIQPAAFSCSIKLFKRIISLSSPTLFATFS